MKNTLQKADEGWSLLVYNGDRRLICSLNTSHAWTFLVGIILGCLLGAITFSTHGHSTDLIQEHQPELAIPNPPLGVD